MRALEERLRLALEGTETGFWEWDVATDVVEWSDNMGPLYGLPRGTQPGGVDDFLQEVVHPDDRGPLGELVQAAVARGESYESDLRVQLPDGGERWLYTKARVVKGPDGRPARIVGLLADVTERRRREEARAFLDAGQPGAREVDGPGAHARGGRAARGPDGSPTGARSSSRATWRHLEQLAVAHVDPEKVRWARELQERSPDPDAPTGAPAVIRSGRWSSTP